MAGYSNDSSGNGKSGASNGKGPTDPSIYEVLVAEEVWNKDENKNPPSDTGSGVSFEQYFRDKDPERTDKVTGACKKCMKIAENKQSKRRHAAWCSKRSKIVKKYQDDLQKYQAAMAAAAVANDSTEGGGGGDSGNNNNAEHTAAVANNAAEEGGGGDGGNNNNAPVPGLVPAAAPVGPPPVGPPPVGPPGANNAVLAGDNGIRGSSNNNDSTEEGGGGDGGNNNNAAANKRQPGKRQAPDDSESDQGSPKRGKKPAAGVKEITFRQKKQHAAAATTTATTTGAAVEANLVKKKTVAQKKRDAAAAATTAATIAATAATAATTTAATTAAVETETVAKNKQANEEISDAEAVAEKKRKEDEANQSQSGQVGTAVAAAVDVPAVTEGATPAHSRCYDTIFVGTHLGLELVTSKGRGAEIRVRRISNKNEHFGKIERNDVLVAIGTTAVVTLVEGNNTTSRLQQVTHLIAQAPRPVILTFARRTRTGIESGDETHQGTGFEEGDNEPTKKTVAAAATATNITPSTGATTSAISKTGAAAALSVPATLGLKRRPDDSDDHCSNADIENKGADMGRGYDVNAPNANGHADAVEGAEEDDDDVATTTNQNETGAIAKGTQDDKEMSFVDEITGNVRIHPIFKCKTLWDDLNAVLKVHLQTLQFTKTKWKNKTLPNMFKQKWKDIRDKAQNAAAAFGCDELSWNTWERSVFERLELSTSEGNNDKGTSFFPVLEKPKLSIKASEGNNDKGTNSVLEENWNDLPKTLRECLIKLGHDESSWNKKNKGKTSSTTKKKSTSLNRTLPTRPTTDNGRMDTTARGQGDRALYWAYQWQHTSTYATEKARKARPMLVHGTCSFTKLKRVLVPGSRRINYQAEPMTKGKAIFMVDEFTARDPKKYGKLLLKYGQFLVDGNTERAEVVSDPNSYYNALYTARDGDAKAPRPNENIMAVKEAERLAENN